MAVRRAFLQIGITLVNVAIVVLVFTSIWPFPSGEFKVDLPSTNDVTWSYSNGNIHVIAPFTIDNGWIYDVNDLVISYRVTNLSRVVLGQDVIPFETIPAHSVTHSQIDFTFNVTRFYEQGGLGMVFADDYLLFDIGVSCLYTMKLIKFEATYQAEVPWDALIQDYGVTSVAWVGTDLSVDYYIATSPMLAPLGSVPMMVSVYDGSGNPLLYPPIVQTVELGTNSSGTFTFTPMGLGAPPYEVHFTIFDFQFVGRWP